MKTLRMFLLLFVTWTLGFLFGAESISISNLLSVSTAQAAYYGPEPAPGEPAEFLDVRLASPQIQELASGIALMMHKRGLVATKTKSGTEYTFANPRSVMKLCKDDPMADQAQARASSCTSFLVAPDVIATAGHCMPLIPCKDAVFIFDFMNTSSGAPKFTRPSSEVFYCKKVLATEFVEKLTLNNFNFPQESGPDVEPYKDYALIRLDRPVQINKVARKPLLLTHYDVDKLSVGDSIFTIGFPKVLPMKFSQGPIMEFNYSFISTELDAVSGNSGGPIFDMNTHEVVGIVKGKPTKLPDEVWKPGASCSHIRRCESGHQCGPEKCEYGKNCGHNTFVNLYYVRKRMTELNIPFE